MKNTILSKKQKLNAVIKLCTEDSLEAQRITFYMDLESDENQDFSKEVTVDLSFQQYI